MSRHPILRFAPSPNGLLHLGHAYSALFTWDMAQHLGGTALLRIEDIDLARCKPEFDAAIQEDLHWLGLEWPEPVLRQSGRFRAYEEAAERLGEKGLIYPCFCSRREIAAAAKGADPDGAPLYPGTCRDIAPQEAKRRIAAGEAVQWRLHMARAVALTGPLQVSMFDRDGSTGSRKAEPALWGDAVLVRKDTPTSYHLSVVVDDAFQGVTHVTRGMDLYRATALHRLLQSLLVLPSPVYCHHELVLDEGAEKLSKSKGAPSLLSLREAGVTAAEVRRRLGFA